MKKDRLASKSTPIISLFYFIFYLNINFYLVGPILFHNLKYLQQSQKIIKSGLGFKSFNTEIKALKGIEAFHMIKKGQVDGINRCALAEIEFINKLFSLVV